MLRWQIDLKKETVHEPVLEQEGLCCMEWVTLVILEHCALPMKKIWQYGSYVVSPPGVLILIEYWAEW